jgi:hypothetical protein
VRIPSAWARRRIAASSHQDDRAAVELLELLADPEHFLVSVSRSFARSGNLSLEAKAQWTHGSESMPSDAAERRLARTSVEGPVAASVRFTVGFYDADPKSVRNAGPLDAVGVEIRNARKTGLTQVATASVET